MDNVQKLRYFSREIVNSMNRIEASKRKMMCEIDAELEKACFNALDEKDLPRVARLYNRLTKMVDESEMDGQNETI